MYEEHLNIVLTCPDLQLLTPLHILSTSTVDPTGNLSVIPPL